VEHVLDLPAAIVELPPVIEPETDGAEVDALLVGAARVGNRGAFAELHGRWAPTIHGVLLASVPRQDVDDLVQDVFLKAFRKLASLRDDLAFGGWLLQIARNRAADYHRRATSTEALRDDVAAPDADLRRALEALDAIRSLPQAYRETLVLRLVEGMTGPEIAERTGLTPDSVRVNLHRGFKLLREKLGGENA
jgi:RNA polymerase sigma-70 factor (ECF subfamily)